MSKETKRPDDEEMEVVTDIGDEDFEFVVEGGPSIDKVTEILEKARARGRVQTNLVVLPGEDLEAEDSVEEEPSEAVPIVHGYVGTPHKQGRGKRTEQFLVDEETLSEAQRGKRKDVKVKPLPKAKRQQNPDHSV